MRTYFQKKRYQALLAATTEFSAEELSASALVVSPHFDDETLGCGGTLLLKKKAGADLSLVFMTDGSTSHRNLVSPEYLRRVRAAEGREAAKAYGIADRSCYLLDFPETQLDQQHPAAVKGLLALLEKNRPEQLFLPATADPLLWSPDHNATTRAALEAAKAYGAPLTLVEYPVWFWYHWPWVPYPWRDNYQAGIVGRLSRSYRLGKSAAVLFNKKVTISEQLKEKRAILGQHRSQMERHPDHPDWQILADVAGGEFLNRFFNGHEFFRLYRVNTQGSGK